MSKEKFISFIICILPIAYIYAFPILINNLGHALLLFFVFPLLFLDFIYYNRNNKLPYTQPYLLFCFYLILISLLAPAINAFSGDTKELLSAAEFSVIVYFLITNRRLSQQFIDVYTRLAVFFALFLLLQYVAFVFFNIRISGVIPFLKFYNREVESIGEGRLLRICSLFAESSHFAVYEIPALIMYLFKKAHQKNILLKIVIISLSILLSTSSNGLIIMIIAYFAFIVYKYYRRINLLYFILGGIILLGAFYFISKSKFIDDVTYGLFVQEVDMTTSKAEMRIYRGFNMYVDLPLDKQLFGVGWRNAQRYCRSCNKALYNTYYADVFDYFNSIAGSLIYSGIIGCFLLCLFFYNLFKHTNDFATRTLVICVFILMGTSSVLMSDQWVFFMAAIISMINKCKNEENYHHSITQRDGHR